jgi:predicted ATPase with chaperone activity
MLCAAMTQLGMSAHAFLRILWLARTIADPAGAPNVQTHHLSRGNPVQPMETGLDVVFPSTYSWQGFGV